MPVALDPLYAKGAKRVGIEVANFPGRIRFSADRTIGVFVSNFRKRREPHPLGTDASDEALIKAIARSDRHAMAVLYGRHHVRVYRFALRVTGDASLAEDIVSEVFLEVWRHADRFKSRAQVSTWLLAIARNKGVTAVKRRSDQQLDVETLEIDDPADDPEVLINKSDRSEAIRRCLSQLSAAQREVIDLVYYHEKSVGDVAKIVGAPASAVKNGIVGVWPSRGKPASRAFSWPPPIVRPAP
jgi:RNA polymerase sigma-70 factor (ECF subfamily)